VKRRALISAGGLAVAGALALPLAASGQDAATTADPAPTTPAQSQGSEKRVNTLGVEVRGLSGGKMDVGHRGYVVGTLRPYVAKERVKLFLMRNGHVIQKAEKRVRKVPGHNSGRVKMRTKRIVKPAHYRGVAIHQPSPALPKDKNSTKTFIVRYRGFNGGSSDSIHLFNTLLNRDGYANAPNGNSYNDTTRRAVLAFRKVNGMPRITSATSKIYKMLADGKGRFKPRYPGRGRHVEVDISRQVMALIDHGKAQYTYHVSTGAPSTPTIRGHYNFYSKQPGYNSSEMYYSVYFHGGYATHGYHSVPTYNASHGCVRNPIPDSKFIYNWIHLGESIWVYG
jgi:hypothetical protein